MEHDDTVNLSPPREGKCGYVNPIIYVMLHVFILLQLRKCFMDVLKNITELYFISQTDMQFYNQTLLFI
jgi:hypothetical protein